MLREDARQAKPAGHSSSSAPPAARGRAEQAGDVPGIILYSRMEAAQMDGDAGQSRDRSRNMREPKIR